MSNGVISDHIMVQTNHLSAFEIGKLLGSDKWVTPYRKSCGNWDFNEPCIKGCREYIDSDKTITARVKRREQQSVDERGYGLLASIVIADEKSE